MPSGNAPIKDKKGEERKSEVKGPRSDLGGGRHIPELSALSQLGSLFSNYETGKRRADVLDTSGQFTWPSPSYWSSNCQSHSASAFDFFAFGLSQDKAVVFSIFKQMALIVFAQLELLVVAVKLPLIGIIFVPSNIRKRNPHTNLHS